PRPPAFPLPYTTLFLSRVRANTVQLDNDGLFGAAVWLGPVAVAGAFDVPAGVLGLTTRGLARGRLRGSGRRTSSPIACRQRRGTAAGVRGGKSALLGDRAGGGAGGDGGRERSGVGACGSGS